MRVLGKPELDDAVRYDELELLLGNFGAQKVDITIKTPERHISKLELEDIDETEEKYKEINTDSFGAEDLLKIPDQKFSKQSDENQDSGLREEMKDVVNSEIQIDTYIGVFKK